MSINAKDIMNAKVVTIHSTATVIEAAKLMKEKGVGHLIVDEAGKPIAIVTEDDLARRVLAENLDPHIEIIKVASKPLITISPETVLGEIAELMSKHKIRRLPVVSKEGSIIGIVTTTDIIKHISNAWLKLKILY
jgi:CBS domain-containing protein